MLSLSDSSGTIVSKAGLTKTQLVEVCELKNEKRGRLSEYSGAGIEYKAGRSTIPTTSNFVIIMSNFKLFCFQRPN